VLTGTEFDEGRFFDPDRDGPALTTGLTPHRRMWENDDVIADYAGQTYTWKIHYFEGAGGLDDGNVDDAVYLDNLAVTGVLGDLNESGMADSTDRNLLVAAIAAPPSLLDLLGGPQYIYDLNADDAVNALDLATYDSFFTVAVPGDYNNNGFVDAADYPMWRDHLGQTFQLDNEGAGQTPGQVTIEDYNFWVSQFGNPGSGAGGGLGASGVPEPTTILLAATGVFGLVVFRRRAA
jgi:hypothetical protein